MSFTDDLDKMGVKQNIPKQGKTLSFTDQLDKLAKEPKTATVKPINTAKSDRTTDEKMQRQLSKQKVTDFVKNKITAPANVVDQRIYIGGKNGNRNNSLNYIGQNILTTKQTDKPLVKVGKGIVNYGVGTLGNLVSAPVQGALQGAGALNSLITGQKINTDDKSIVRDVLHAQPALDNLASKGKAGQFVAGFLNAAGESILDPTTYIGGGIVDDMAKAGRFGAAAKLGTTENLLYQAERNANIVKKLKAGKVLSDTEKEIVKKNPELAQLPEAKKLLLLPEPKLHTPDIIEAMPVKPTTDDIATLKIKPSEVVPLKKYEGFSNVDFDTLKNELIADKNQILDNQVQWLKNTFGKGVQPGGLMKDADGNVVGRFGRISNNEKWYQTWAKENNYRRPTNKDLKTVAEKQLQEGYETLNGMNPSDETYIQLDKLLKEVEQQSANPQKYQEALNKAKQYLDAKRNTFYKVSEQYKKETPFTVTKSTIPPKVSTKYAKETTGDIPKAITKAEDIKPVEPKAETNIDDLIANSDTWKDKSTVQYNRETLERNVEDIAGKDAPKLKSYLVEPVQKNEAERMRFLNKERSDLKQLNIKPRSHESQLVMEFGEGKINLVQLKARTPKWESVVNADKVLRQKYDTYIDKINEALVRNDYAPIPKRKDYFMHFQEISDKLEMFGIPNNKLPTDINGITDDFQPGKNFFASAMHRTSDKSSMDALLGVDKYIDGASKLIYHTDDIKRLRTFEQAIRDKYKNSKQLSNFVANLREHTNNLAGKKSRADRAGESLVGRNIYRATDILKKQVSANAVGGNISSALTNFIPLTQSMATTRKDAFVQGMLETLANTFKNDDFVNKSDFLTRRMGSDPLNVELWTGRTDLTKLQKGVGNVGAVYNKAREAGGWIFKVIDNFVSQTIVRSKYLEGIKKGLNEATAMKRADEWATRMMADRSLGSQPVFFNNKGLVGAFTQFQLEVNNQLSFIFKDIPRNSPNFVATASSIAQVFLYGYLFNNLFEKATGKRPAFDPIGVIQKAYDDYNNSELNKNEATNNLIDNAKNQLPFISMFEGGRIPLSSALPDLEGLARGKTTLNKETAKIPSLVLRQVAVRLKRQLKD